MFLYDIILTQPLVYLHFGLQLCVTENMLDHCGFGLRERKFCYRNNL